MADRILAIGDIHGCHVALRSVLEFVAPDQSDTVVSLGDIVDRGPDSSDVVRQLIDLGNRTQFLGILGNHDEMFLNAIANNKSNDRWLSAGGMATLVSYLGSLKNVPDPHITFIRSFHDALETDTHIFVHANVDSNSTLENQSVETLRWTRLTGRERPHFSGKRVICGHTGLPTGVPAILDGIVDIDTWAYGGKWLTCLDTTNDLVYQASQSGDIRGPTPLSEIAMDFT